MDEAQIDCLSAIYDAVLEPASWPRMLDLFAMRMGAYSAVAATTDARHPELEIFQIGASLPADEIARYVSLYGAEEAEAFANIARAPRFSWLLEGDVFGQPMETYAHPRFLAERFGVMARAAIRVNDGSGWLDTLSLLYRSSSPPLPSGAKAFATPLLPHFDRLFALNRPFRLLRARFAVVMAALDRLQLGVAVAGPTGEIILHNQACERILALKDGVALGRDRRLRLGASSVSAALDRAVRAAIVAASGAGDDGFARLVAPRPSGAEGFLIEIDALRGTERELEPGLRGALIVLIDPADAKPVRVEGLQTLYALTDAEADVLSAIVRGIDAPGIAERRNTAVATVRSQIQSVAQKTDTQNRAQLVRLALSVNPPVDRPD